MISADGSAVTFDSSASNLVPGDLNNRQDIFEKDLLTGRTTLMSVSSDDVQGDLDSWGQPAISVNGGYVTFTSAATTLVSGDTNGQLDIFEHAVDAASHQPDMLVKDAGLFIGDGVYGSLASQTADRKIAPGRAIRIRFKLENDGTDTDTYVLSGLRPVRRFHVTYTLGADDVTTQVLSGTLVIRVSAATSVLVVADIHAAPTARPGKQDVVRLDVVSRHDPTRTDVARGIVAVG